MPIAVRGPAPESFEVLDINSLGQSSDPAQFGTSALGQALQIVRTDVDAGDVISIESR